MLSTDSTKVGSIENEFRSWFLTILIYLINLSLITISAWEALVSINLTSSLFFYSLYSFQTIFEMWLIIFGIDFGPFLTLTCFIWFHLFRIKTSCELLSLRIPSLKFGAHACHLYFVKFGAYVNGVMLTVPFNLSSLVTNDLLFKTRLPSLFN